MRADRLFIRFIAKHRRVVAGRERAADHPSDAPEQGALKQTSFRATDSARVFQDWMSGPYSQSERQCDACGEMFWGTEAAHFCSKPCRQRSWRARQAWAGLRELSLPSLCREVHDRGKLGGASYSKLLPRLFRATAAELRKRGWDPIELLINRPDEPASEADTAPGGIEGASPQRRRCEFRKLWPVSFRKLWPVEAGLIPAWPER